MKQGDLVRITTLYEGTSEIQRIVIGIITKELGKFGVEMWFNVLLDGKIEAVRDDEIEVIDETG